MDRTIITDNPVIADCSMEKLMEHLSQDISGLHGCSLFLLKTIVATPPIQPKVEKTKGCE